MFRGETVVCISAIDWDFIWQSHQEVMRRLARAGNRVVYVETLGIRTPGLRDASRVLRRVWNWLRSRGSLRAVEPGVSVHSPVLVPFPFHPLARRVNQLILKATVARSVGRLGVERPIVWVFLPTPIALDLALMLEPKVLLYYCVDDLKESSPGARRVAESERELIERADLVFATSYRLQRACQAVRPDVYRFPAGVDLERFSYSTPHPAPDDFARIPAPRAIYVGGVHRWIDYELLAAVARRLPQVSFVLVGPVQTNVEDLSALGNVHLIGQRSHSDLPAYLAGADVALIPYRRGGYVDSVYPSKLNEYLAMGKPVVATRIPELERYASQWPGTITFADEPADFAAAISSAMAERDPDSVRRRVAAAEENDWPQRVERMAELVEGVMRGHPRRTAS